MLASAVCLLAACRVQLRKLPCAVRLHDALRFPNNYSSVILKCGESYFFSGDAACTKLRLRNLRFLGTNSMSAPPVSHDKCCDFRPALQWEIKDAKKPYRWNDGKKIPYHQISSRMVFYDNIAPAVYHGILPNDGICWSSGTPRYIFVHK